MVMQFLQENLVNLVVQVVVTVDLRLLPQYQVLVDQEIIHPHHQYHKEMMEEQQEALLVMVQEEVVVLEG
jgi:hypothetical protein